MYPHDIVVHLDNSSLIDSLTDPAASVPELLMLYWTSHRSVTKCWDDDCCVHMLLHTARMCLVNCHFICISHLCSASRLMPHCVCIT